MLRKWFRDYRAVQARDAPQPEPGVSHLGVPMPFPPGAWFGVITDVSVALLLPLSGGIIFCGGVSTGSWVITSVVALLGLALVVLALHAAWRFAIYQHRGGLRAWPREGSLLEVTTRIARKLRRPDDTATDLDRTRWRRAALVTTIASDASYLAVFMATVLSLVTAGGSAHSTIDRFRYALGQLAWNALDMIPLLSVPHTLGLDEYRPFTSTTAGVLVVVFKAFLVVPLIRVAQEVLRTRDPAVLSTTPTTTG